MGKKKSLIGIANTKIPFPLAARWAGLDVWGGDAERGVKVYCPFGEFEHPDGGKDPAMRVYADHGWCFAESRYFTVVSLLAEVWGLSKEDAAVKALDDFGWKPPTVESMWAEANREPAVDQDSLARALVIFCQTLADFEQRRLEGPVSDKLSQCLRLLPRVRTPEDGAKWLSACQQAMLAVLT